MCFITSNRRRPMNFFVHRCQHWAAPHNCIFYSTWGLPTTAKRHAPVTAGGRPPQAGNQILPNCIRNV
eukprot:974402-Pyramimonas_sp.AAC.1